MCAEFVAEHASVSPGIFHSKSFLAFFPESDWPTFPSRTTLTHSIIPEMVKEIIDRNRKVCFYLFLSVLFASGL